MLEVSFFGGISPKVAPRLLSPVHGTENVNAIPVDGNLRATGAPQQIAILDSPLRSLYVAERAGGNTVYGWEQKGVVVQPLPGNFRYAAADEKYGARLFVPAETDANYAPPPAAWVLGMPPPRVSPDVNVGGSPATEGTAIFYAVSFVADWGSRGLLYESPLSPPIGIVDGNNNTRNISFAVPSLNDISVSGIVAAGGGYRFSFDSAFYVRVGERVEYAGREGVVLEVGETDAIVRFDDSGFVPRARDISLEARPARLSLGELRWQPLLPDGMAFTGVSATITAAVEGLPADSDLEFSFAALSQATANPDGWADFVTDENGENPGYEVNVSGSWLIRARAADATSTNSQFSGVEYYGRVVADSPALAAGDGMVIASGDAIVI